MVHTKYQSEEEIAKLLAAVQAKKKSIKDERKKKFFQTRNEKFRLCSEEEKSLAREINKFKTALAYWRRKQIPPDQ